MTANHAEFLKQVEPFRAELKAHCYRMSGSASDAEDLVQDSLIKAWKNLGQFEGRSSLRRWLYTVATRTCLDALESKRSRILPTALGPASPADADPMPPTEEVSWLEPYPDSALESLERNPEARYSARESVALAFLSALQLLPAKQRAVLLLRDVLGWQATECAELLETSVPAVNSALQRARETLEKQQAEPPKVLPDDASIKSLLSRYIKAWETADASALVALLHEDAVLSMPPLAMWMLGAKNIGAAIARMVLRPGTAGSLKLIPAQLNGQPALAAYTRDGAVFKATALHVLTVTGDRVSRLDAFVNPAMFEQVGLPATTV
jgi:RNA polymerase sigma-70 factor (ECF subfamily)